MHLPSILRATLSIRTVLLATAQAQLQQDININIQGSCDSRSNNGVGNCEGGTMSHDKDYKTATSVYEFNAKDIDGNDVSLEKYRGQVLIIVNVACKCGFTNDHYKELVALHDKYRAKGLSILGFPCNQFGSQEPAPENEIKEFVKGFNVDFDMFSKVEVNGSGAHPLWKYLKHKQGGTLIDAIKWNFTKFIVDREGQPVGRYSPQTSPKELDEILLKYL